MQELLFRALQLELSFRFPTLLFAYVSVGLTNAIFHGKTATPKKCNDLASGIVMLSFTSAAASTPRSRETMKPRNRETHVHGGHISINDLVGSRQWSLNIGLPRNCTHLFGGTACLYGYWWCYCGYFKWFADINANAVP